MSAAKHGQIWGTYARDWATYAEPQTRPLWEAMWSASRPQSGEDWLDLGCGAGGASCLAAELGAQISGSDEAEALLQIARERLPQGDFRVGDLTAIPFSDRSFDGVFAANSLQFATSRATAIQEIKRVLKPSGRLVVGTWAEPERCQMTSMFRIVGGYLPPPANPEPSLSVRENLLDMLSCHGFHVESEGEVHCPFRSLHFEEAWRGFRSAGMVVLAAEIAGESKLKSEVGEALRPFVQPDGSLCLENWFRFVVARLQSRA